MKDLKQHSKNLQQQNRIAWLVYSTPDGKKFVDDLVTSFSGKLLKKDDHGRVDPLAVAAAIGEQNVINHILEMIKDGQLAR